jgi:hypothetical protein
MFFLSVASYCTSPLCVTRLGGPPVVTASFPPKLRISIGVTMRASTSMMSAFSEPTIFSDFTIRHRERGRLGVGLDLQRLAVIAEADGQVVVRPRVPRQRERAAGEHAGAHHLARLEGLDDRLADAALGRQVLLVLIPPGVVMVVGEHHGRFVVDP